MTYLFAFRKILFVTWDYGTDGKDWWKQFAVQYALDKFHYTCTRIQSYIQCIDVECRALYRVRIHYAQRKIYKHHVRLVRLYEYKTVHYECTTTPNLFLVHLYVLYNVLNIVGVIQCLNIIRFEPGPFKLYFKTMFYV